MLTADMLYAELMRGCLDGKAFTFVRELGQCRTQTVETEDGTAETPLDSFQPIQDAVAAVKKMLERCPELKATYPQKTVSESYPDGENGPRITLRQTDAVIEVPEEFAAQHSGKSFVGLLEKDWAEQTDTLVQQIAKRLRRYEIRTAAMFSSAYDRTQITLTVAEEEIRSEIWTYPLEKCGLYPLQWDSEICGMAQFLRDRLDDVLKEDFDHSQVFTILRNETEHYCTLRIIYVQTE